MIKIKMIGTETSTQKGTEGATSSAATRSPILIWSRGSLRCPPGRIASKKKRKMTLCWCLMGIKNIKNDPT